MGQGGFSNDSRLHHQAVPFFAIRLKLTITVRLDSYLSGQYVSCRAAPTDAGVIPSQKPGDIAETGIAAASTSSFRGIGLGGFIAVQLHACERTFISRRRGCIEDVTVRTAQCGRPMVSCVEGLRNWGTRRCIMRRGRKMG